ncbi:hypothetical protein M8J75_010236 [Diaphorina citri]|nr:hypothetical protein M8J75_010236 [Diaphorina citri]
MICYRRNILNVILVLFVCGVCGFFINHAQHVYNRIQKHERLVDYEEMVININDHMRHVERRVLDDTTNQIPRWTKSLYSKFHTTSNDTGPNS